MKKEGNIKISSENMMPIIKKWLYSDKDIFLREIVANASDAITKFKKLVDIGEAKEDGEEYCIKISIDKSAGTLTVEDNGLGMTADEVEKYITQIAFSGASDFLAKYEKAGGDGIIGHFGLGFYSAYMVSDNVEIFTKSYKKGAGVHWQSDGNATYKIEDCDIKRRGTTIVMHIAPAEKEFLEEGNIRNLIRKYCLFMPYNVYLSYKGDGKDEPLNTTTPLYAKNPKDCTDEEYKQFYRDTFMDYNEQIFWVHLNMDYPFNLKGILFFPKVRNQVELDKGKVKLFCNQVFIADNIKEVIPEFLMLLNGVIDCPDIPLNVSRSFLQNDAQVQKISKHITKKVSEKLISLFKKDRAKYEACWDDTANFIKFGCIKDEEFFDKVKDIIIYKDLDDKFVSFNEAIGEDSSEEKQDSEKNDTPKTIYYVSDAVQQAQYIKMFKTSGLKAIISNTFIDPHFLSYVEYKMPHKFKFMRIDAEFDGALKTGDGAEDSALAEIFKNVLANDKLTIKFESLKSTIPAFIITDEYMRRYSEMGQMYGMSNGEVAQTLVVNLSSPIIGKIKDLDSERQNFAINYVYALALLSFKKLDESELDKFVNANLFLLDKYIN